jgi:Tfp pilus assembly protein FimT
MAMTMEDRDNMTLDDVATALGPYFPGLPSGLQLNLKVQGDCIRTCQDMTNTFPHRQLTPTLIRYGEPVLRTLGGEAITVQLLERERLRNHLGWMADFLEFAGLNALAQRLRRHRNSTDPDLVNGLLNRIDGFALRRLTQGIGVITHDQAQRLNLVGPVARASGVATDTRSLDSAYQALKFTPQVETAGDVWARWRVRVRECRQSLALLHQAGDTLTLAREGARGCYARNSAGGLDTPTKANLAAVKPNLAGLEWFEAILFLTSLDLDMTEAALG